MSAARERARQILDELEINDPALLTHLHEICIERGAYVREHKLDTAEARLTVTGDRGIITVNPHDNYTARTRFSIAHELGHFELHRHSGESIRCDQRAMNDWTGKQPVNKREREANEFASELLMPEKFVKAPIEFGTPSFRFLSKLSDRFQTSLFATLKRFIDLTDEPCAAVFFKGGKISYAWKSSSFERQKFWLGGDLRPGSFAFQVSKRQPVPDYMAAVKADSWFDVPPSLESEILLEQARYFQNLDLGISLLWINSKKLLRKS